MNPFRKKSTAPVSTTPVVDVPPDLWGDIIHPAPIASPEAVGENPWADVPPSTTSPPPSVVLSPAKPPSTVASTVAATTTSPPQPKVAPRSPPPPVAPRRRSQIQRKAPVPEPEPEPETVEPPIDDPFNTDTSEPETPPLNPFNRSFSEPPEPAPPKQRQSLDVDAFKRLMLTGYADTPPAATTKDGSSTSESSGSRLSIFEPILESKGGETPRSSEEVDVEGRRKPPPPRPRRVSPPLGRSASIRLSVPPPPPPAASTLTSPATSPPIGSVSPIIRTPSSPPQATPPASPATSLKKRLVPSPPVSRRQSVRSSVELERPSTPNGGSGKVKPPPPPPPVRRMKSTNHRTHERTPSTGNMPPPPPPPPPRGRTVSGSTIEEKVPEEKDILIDLQKLQREVDELRGKYEQGIVMVE
ncbi:uncharacterized protein LAJ45_09911 [Morchella importuna]|uniref:uncharacterized protein n=1 Tax=Morchella importuna TaxID=1174673 RepID=UPI001E8EE3FA|nr:uncharacterized protein LAJ45_09911 [Morchella importuna]KAH8145989.1 hypothetical protein LAJ45_09911 [Morchella importuna]